MIILNKLPLFPPPVVGLDIETTGLDRFGCDIRAIGISDGETTWILTQEFGRIIPLLEDPSTLKIIHNSTFDLTVLAYQLKCFPVNIWDTLIVERVIWNGFDYDNGLDDVLARRMGIILNKEIRSSFIDYYGPLSDEQIEYLEKDCIYLPKLREIQIKDIWERQLKQTVELENNTILPVLDMTLTGVGFRSDLWDDIYKQIDEVIERLKREMQEDLGEDFYIEVSRKKKGETYLQQISVDEIGWGSWQQLRPVLVKVLGFDPGSTDKGTLEEYSDFPFVEHLLQYKKWSKLQSWRWDDFISSETGRIHPTWNQVGADTGRFSSKDPNMQQVPRNTPGYPNMRSLFSPLPGHVIISCDYSQQEPRLLAGISNDPKMIEAANESDIYCAFARTIWNKEVTKKDPERQLAKTGVLASEYGVYPKRLSKQLGISVNEATSLRKRILDAYPTATEWGNGQLRQVVQYGYSKTLIGRRRYFPEIRNTPQDKLWKYANVSRNTPVQGSGVDVMKLALCKVFELLKGYDAHIMLTVHDEMVVSANKSQAEELYPQIIRAMEDAATEICPNVRFVAEGKISDIWEH